MSKIDSSPMNQLFDREYSFSDMNLHGIVVASGTLKCGGEWYLQGVCGSALRNTLW